MKLIVLFYLCYCSKAIAWKTFHLGRISGGNLGSPASENKYNLPPEEWFEQNLDHFNPTDERTWKQRFYTNKSFYNANIGGPVFLMIGGEGEATAKWMVEGAWIDYAKRFGALCFQLEHRFYGKSQPFPTLNTKLLQYLSSQQALADLATFIEAMNNKYKFPSNTKWIVFGGSYPGSLAAWMRVKYPHLVAGAMSASGPLLAQIDFMDYYRIVDEALSTYSDECLQEVQKGTKQVDISLRHMVSQRNINKIFRLCDPIDQSIENKNDISNFYESLASNFAGVVQYNKDNRHGKNNKVSNITIDTLCNIMTNKSSKSALDKLGQVNSLLLDATDQKCLDYKYEKMIKDLRNCSIANEGARQWTYQTCTEFGFYQTSSYQPQVFGNKFPVNFFVQMCSDVFGPKFNMEFLNKAVDRTNTLYGALDIEVSNVVFVHGSIDPWHALGITKTQSNNAPAIYIKGTAHCANMYPKSENDLPDLQAAREQIAEFIDSWIRL